MSTSSKEALHAYTTFPVLDLKNKSHRVRIIPKSNRHTPDHLGLLSLPMIFYASQRALLLPTDIRQSTQPYPGITLKYYYSDFLKTLAQEGEFLPKSALRTIDGKTQYDDLLVVIVRFPHIPKDEPLCKQSNTTGYTATIYFAFTGSYW